MGGGVFSIKSEINFGEWDVPVLLREFFGAGCPQDEINPKLKRKRTASQRSFLLKFLKKII
jgi:hypothetical protein